MRHHGGVYRCPLKPEWREGVRARLQDIEPGLPDAAGLRQGLDGEAFDRALGAFLKWQSHLADTSRFRAFAESQPETHPSSQIPTWVHRIAQRAERIVDEVEAFLADRRSSATGVTDTTSAYDRPARADEPSADVESLESP
jgi:hypothetical protein